MNQPVIILGMHRSGTSLIAKILQQNGLFIGNDLDDNFESQFFCKLNDWAMFQAGATWDNPYNMNFLTDKFISEISDSFNNRINSRFIKKYHKNFNKLILNKKFWGWKDPRNTFTLSIWLNIFPNAKLVHIYRNPIDVAKSLQNREIKFQKIKNSNTKTGIKKYLYKRFLLKKRIFSQSQRINNIYEGIKLWEQYTSKALLINNNIFHLSYENLLNNPSKIIKQISKFLNLKTSDQDITKSIYGLNKNRKFAFLENKELIEIYKKTQNNSLLDKLNYKNLHI